MLLIWEQQSKDQRSIFTCQTPVYLTRNPTPVGIRTQRPLTPGQAYAVLRRLVLEVAARKR